MINGTPCRINSYSFILHSYITHHLLFSDNPPKEILIDFYRPEKDILYLWKRNVSASFACRQEFYFIIHSFAMILIPKLLRKLFPCFVICLFLNSFTAYSQKTDVQGSVMDTLNRTHLENAVIYLKNPKDSSLIRFTRADTKGNFNLPGLAAGRLIMVVTYPNYVDWIDTVTITGLSPLKMDIALTTKAHLLQEVIVKQTIAPIRIKGDTTEYLADSFHVKPGATVEDLLKVMPGISVNSKGEITTQGQKVQKVLVDGDEFFGDDPTMATQNLNAKDVAKVQVFDKKSDQAHYRD